MSYCSLKISIIINEIDYSNKLLISPSVHTRKYDMRTRNGLTDVIAINDITEELQNKLSVNKAKYNENQISSCKSRKLSETIHWRWVHEKSFRL